MSRWLCALDPDIENLAHCSEEATDPRAVLQLSPVAGLRGGGGGGCGEGGGGAAIAHV